MTTESSKDASSRKLTSPAAIVSVAVGTYSGVVALLLTMYYSFNQGIPSGSPKYQAASAFTMGLFVSFMIAYAVSSDFKKTWVLPYFLTALLISFVSIPLHFAAPDFIEWYTGPLWVGLLGGVALTIGYFQKRRRNNIPNPDPHDIERLD